MPLVSYNGLVVDVLDAHLEDAIAHFSTCPRNERKAVLKSVVKSLDRVVRMTAAQKAALTPEQMQNVADDVGLWFAGEVVAGRAEQYRAAALSPCISTTRLPPPQSASAMPC